jgi:hypothetical protein
MHHVLKVTVVFLTRSRLLDPSLLILPLLFPGVLEVITRTAAHGRHPFPAQVISTYVQFRVTQVSRTVDGTCPT